MNGDIPSRRSGHSFTIIGSNGYLFGGIDYKSPPGPTNELYCLKLQNDDLFSWKVVQANGQKPLPRWRHSANVVEQTTVLIFGGFHNSTNRFNDIHIFDTVSLSWSQPIANQCDFTPRGNHIRKKILVPLFPLLEAHILQILLRACSIYSVVMVVTVIAAGTSMICTRWT